MKKGFIGFGLFLLVSAVISGGMAAYEAYYDFYHDDYSSSAYNNRYIRPYRPVARSYSNYAPYNYQNNYFRPNYFRGNNMRRPDYYEPAYRYENYMPYNYQDNFYQPSRDYDYQPVRMDGNITMTRQGNRYIIEPTSTTRQRYSNLSWEWHYDSRAVNCNVISGNRLSCWRVTANLPAEIYAEFAAYVDNRRENFDSNMIDF